MVWTIVGLYVMFVVAIHLPSVQKYMGEKVANFLQQELGTKVTVGSVDISLFNHLAIGDVVIEDQQREKMLQAERIATSVDICELMRSGKIVVYSAQLFGVKANLYKNDSISKPNFQFVIDSLAPKDDEPQKPLDLRIQSLIIRDGTVAYNQMDSPEPTATSAIDPHHLCLTDINSNISLRRLTNDSIVVSLRSLSLKERSGLDLRSLSCKINASERMMRIEDMQLELPKTSLIIPHAEINMAKRKDNQKNVLKHYDITIAPSRLSPSDLAFLDKHLLNSEETLAIRGNASGSDNTLAINNLHITDTDNRLSIIGNGSVTNLQSTPAWKVNANDLKLSADGIKYIVETLHKQHVEIPVEIGRLGNIHFKGAAEGMGDFIAGKGTLLSDAGNATFDASIKGNSFHGTISTKDINLARILNDNSLGFVTADVNGEGIIAANESPLPFQHLKAKGTIQRLDYNNYSYRNIALDGTYKNKSFDGQLSMNDPNGNFDIKGSVNLAAKRTEANIQARIANLNPKALRLTDGLGDYVYNLNTDTHISGSSLSDAVGFINVKDFNMKNHEDDISINNLYITTGYEDGEHTIDLHSDFGNVLVKGKYDINTLSQSVINLIASKIPTMPSLPKYRQKTNNDIVFIADILDMNWFHQILDIPIETDQPIHIKGALDDNRQMADIEVSAPSFSYGSMLFRKFNATVETVGDTIFTIANIEKMQDDGTPILLDVNAKAFNNKLQSHIFCDTHGDTPLKGMLNAETDFLIDDSGHRVAHIRIHPSEILVDKSIWHVQPSDILYGNNQLTIDYFQINNNNQHINISGRATQNPNDSLVVDLNNIDVGYVLDLVNFHSVEFSGFASGKATVKNLFHAPDANASLIVNDFRFEKGRMGTLYASANYDVNTEQINISARTDDEPYVIDDGKKTVLTGDTYINGFVSPKRNDLNIHILTDGARAEFIEEFCGSFMRDVEARAQGWCRVFGGFKNVNIEGNFITDGPLSISTLNTTYTLKHDTVALVPDYIYFPNDTVYDREGHTAVVSGGLRHHNLKNMTYDIGIQADNFLAYDFHDFGNSTFYGTVYGTGTCDIVGKKGEVNINVNAEPKKGSFIEYNAAHPDNINKADYIEWRDANDMLLQPLSHSSLPTLQPKSTTDVHINMYADINQNFDLRILMDENTGDKITLTGDGDIRGSYFNKGAFDIYGTFLIDHGTYVMTIQNVIKKLFTFQQGSSMTFSGEPFGAALNLKGQYVIPAVSLSDLQMGRSFTQNNIRAICLMNIGGTAGDPQVTFGLDLPTLSSDAKQMVMSVINSQEDLNQQVLYLLAVGRFMPQRNNNAVEDESQQSQTSLAMQSILSGTISQQINNVLMSMVKVPNWNFGANISTGNDGFSNAEYEGLLSGRLLNNRLIINGQFGYRDNVQTDQSSFIGDFDVQYLLRPNGNLAVKVYNQTNDRYFTRNSLNTQGVGLIIKKDFNSLSEIFGKKKKKNKKKKDQTVTIDNINDSIKAEEK